MIISDTHKFVFIHIPKTAGISIRKTLEPYATIPVYKRKMPNVTVKQKNPKLFQHATARNVKNLVVKGDWESYFTFAFVRNPWDWMVSWYLFWKTKSKAGGAICTNAKKMNFNQYVAWYHTTKPQPARNRMRLGFSEFTKENGKSILTYVGRFERFEQEFTYICNEIGVPVKLFKLNTTNRKKRHYRDFYNKKSINLVSRIFRSDIADYGYAF